MKLGYFMLKRLLIWILLTLITQPSVGLDHKLTVAYPLSLVRFEKSIISERVAVGAQFSAYFDAPVALHGIGFRYYDGDFFTGYYGGVHVYRADIGLNIEAFDLNMDTNVMSAEVGHSFYFVDHQLTLDVGAEVFFGARGGFAPRIAAGYKF